MEQKGNSSIFLALIIGGFIIAAAIFWARGNETSGVPLSGALAPRAADTEKIQFNKDDYPVLGNPAVSVAMTVFSDFQCHFCKKFAMEIKPAIIEKYVKTGKIKIVLRDFAFLSEESNWAAEAAHCANEQEKYWDYIEKLHAVQQGHDQLAFSRENLKKISQEIGLDSGQFNRCFDSGKYIQKVKDSFEQGAKIGVTGTPTVFINNQKIDGVQPLSAYEEAIERELKQ